MQLLLILSFLLQTSSLFVKRYIHMTNEKHIAKFFPNKDQTKCFIVFTQNGEKLIINNDGSYKFSNMDHIRFIIKNSLSNEKTFSS